jgi:multiple sugar transport system substrate-binding protein
MRGLITSGASPAAVTTFQEPQAMNAFDQGDAAFLRNWDYAWSNSQTPNESRVVGKVGVVPLPTFAGQGGTGHACIGGWDIYINPHSKHIAQDLKFIEFITGYQAEYTMASKFSEIPTNYAVQSDPKVKALNPVLAIVSKTHLVGRPSQTPYYAKVSQAIYSNINAALSGQVSVKTALEQANSQLKSAGSSSSL